MKIILLFPGKAKPAAAETLIAEYAKRMKPLGPCEIHIYKDERIDNRSPDEVKKNEAQRILNYLKPDDYLIACDENGTAITTQKLVEFMQNATLGHGKLCGKSRAVIVIGGALGLSTDIKKRADALWSLSGLIMAGSIARVVLTEAVYRALTIIKGHPYHNV